MAEKELNYFDFAENNYICLKNHLENLGDFFIALNLGTKMKIP